jgi:hypothetical protein
MVMPSLPKRQFFWDDSCLLRGVWQMCIVLLEYRRLSPPWGQMTKWPNGDAIKVFSGDLHPHARRNYAGINFHHANEANNH